METGPRRLEANARLGWESLGEGSQPAGRRMNPERAREHQDALSGDHAQTELCSDSESFGRLGALLKPYVMNTGGGRVADHVDRLRRRYDDEHPIHRLRQIVQSREAAFAIYGRRRWMDPIDAVALCAQRAAGG